MASLKKKVSPEEDLSRGFPLVNIHGFGLPSTWKEESSGYKMFVWPDLPMPNAKVGIEIEVENIYKNCSFEGYWTPKEDGSLRNHGMEYVSAPIHGKHIPYALTGLMNSLKATNPKYHFSPRTSIHIHLDMSTYAAHDLSNVLMLYTVVESFLFKFAGKDRDKSVFCVPYSTTHFGERIFSSLAERAWYSGVSKYMAVNLSRLRDLGTLEFRQLPGTDDVKKIVTWICLIQQLLKRAREVDHKTLSTRIQELNTTSEYFMFLSWVFEDYIQYLDLNNHRQDMEHGVKCVKLFSYIFQSNIFKFEQESPLYKAVEKDMVKKRSVLEDYPTEFNSTILQTNHPAAWPTIQANPFFGNNTTFPPMTDIVVEQGPQTEEELMIDDLNEVETEEETW